MTTEEKYQEIVESRAKAESTKTDPKPEESKDQSGVKADPQAEKEPKTDPKPEESPKDGGKDGDGKEKGPAKTTETDEKAQQQHAFAELRYKSKRENDALRKQIEELKQQIAANSPKPEAKTFKDFEKPEDYEKYIRETLKDELRNEILNEVETRSMQKAGRDEFTARLREDLEKTFGKEVSEKVVSDLNDPESEMSMMITDERAKPIVEAIKSSKRRADLLALMQAKPQIFQEMMELPERKQEYRIYQLEDQINARYAQIAAKQAEEKQKQERAASVPSPGNFGNQGNGNEGISGLSTTARVNRYKEEILKNRKTR